MGGIIKLAPAKVVLFRLLLMLSRDGKEEVWGRVKG